MPDHIVRLGLTALHTYLNNLKPGQTVKFTLITEFELPSEHWDKFLNFLNPRPDVNMLGHEQEAGLITLTCTAETIRALLEQPELSDHLVAINNDKGSKK